MYTFWYHSPSENKIKIQCNTTITLSETIENPGADLGPPQHSRRTPCDIFQCLHSDNGELGKLDYLHMCICLNWRNQYECLVKYIN